MNRSRLNMMPRYHCHFWVYLLTFGSFSLVPLAIANDCGGTCPACQICDTNTNSCRVCDANKCELCIPTDTGTCQVVTASSLTSDKSQACKEEPIEFTAATSPAGQCSILTWDLDGADVIDTSADGCKKRMKWSSGGFKTVRITAFPGKTCSTTCSVTVYIVDGDWVHHAPAQCVDGTESESKTPDTISSVEVLAQSVCNGPYVSLKVAGYPGGASGYSSFTSSASVSNTLYEESWRYEKSSNLVSPAPFQQFHFTGTIKFDIFTQGDPTNGDSSTDASATVTSSGSVSIAATGICSDECSGSGSSDVDVSKTETMTASVTATATILDTGMSYTMSWTGEKWYCSDTTSKAFNMYVQNAADGVVCNGTNSLSASANASGAVHAEANLDAWGAQIDEIIEVVGFTFEKN